MHENCRTKGGRNMKQEERDELLIKIVKGQEELYKGQEELYKGQKAGQPYGYRAGCRREECGIYSLSGTCDSRVFAG